MRQNKPAELIALLSVDEVKMLKPLISMRLEVIYEGRLFNNLQIK